MASDESSPVVENEQKNETQEEPVEEGEEVSKVVESQTVHEDTEEQAEEEAKDEEKGEESTEGGAEEEKEEEEEEEKPRRFTEADIRTAPTDFRFPTTNQARHCFTRYIEYHKCIREKSEDDPECNKYARYYRSLCPGEWIDRWNEQRENGTFPGPL